MPAPARQDLSPAASWRAAFETLHAALDAASRRRDERRVVVDGELGWVTHERQVMLDQVNALRAGLGRSPATMEQVRFAEGRAEGHIDYVKKFALGCADLVVSA